MPKDYGWTKNKTEAHDYLLPKLLEVLNELLLDKKALILDAGCGGGYLLERFFKEGYKNIYGFDLAESGIDIARREFPEIKDRFEKHDCYVSQLPASLPAKDYDAVLSVEVIEHLYEPRVYLKNINSWLKPAGMLVITTPYHGYLKNLALSVAGAWDKHFTVDWDGGHIKFFSRKTLILMLEEAGFEAVSFYGCGRVPFLWKSMVLTARKK